MGASVGSGSLTSVEICAGAGGQAVGLHKAGYAHRALVEIDPHAAETLRSNARRLNISSGKVIEDDLNSFVELGLDEFRDKFGIEQGELDLLAGGVPCPPFSLAGRQLGRDDERDLFPAMLELVGKLRPKAVMIENVRGLLEPRHKFSSYRKQILDQLRDEYDVAEEGLDLDRSWRILEARDFRVPQLRPRAILVAIRRDVLQPGTEFVWPVASSLGVVSVFEALHKTMKQRFYEHGEEGKKAFARWKAKAKSAQRHDKSNAVAPTLVGGSKKHGGADLGPTRAKRAWAELGIDAMGVANDPRHCVPDRDLFRETGPMLTVEQAAIIQGFPRDWEFSGGKTARYRQVGNAFPPPVAEAVGRAIAAVLRPELRDQLLVDLEMENGISSRGLDSIQLDIFRSVGSEPVPA
ncbi:DNA (cytosine-5)-methyltransferase 1 [Saccharopolyspora shandongensis]|uniref:Cytosine-specific methyltransferase n=1 Tax=Saccharopolyspora shandongensis TaxID=418495 RepID=A0A1H3U6T4_9PSEU|nr:DNA (cytosine-5-)-methyltransferase [Saccharopolyspora shandongensis]SDZ58213.1 DNA (cytosine-5)-methyltransferase 1 [Saccharopolyspora shandongensis]